MSVLVKGWGMPSNCDSCEFMDYEDVSFELIKYCRMIGMYIDDPLVRPYGCPLVELPKHHGRLIDENEVRTVMNWLLTQPQRPTWNDTYQAIQEMNAVVEAE